MSRSVVELVEGLPGSFLLRHGGGGYPQRSHPWQREKLPVGATINGCAAKPLCEKTRIFARVVDPVEGLLVRPYIKSVFPTNKEQVYRVYHLAVLGTQRAGGRRGRRRSRPARLPCRFRVLLAWPRGYRPRPGHPSSCGHPYPVVATRVGHQRHNYGTPYMQALAPHAVTPAQSTGNAMRGREWRGEGLR